MTDATLAQRLRDTTEEMACSAAVPMDLWNRHSNACLEAASTITSLQEQVKALTVQVECITYNRDRFATRAADYLADRGRLSAELAEAREILNSLLTLTVFELEDSGNANRPPWKGIILRARSFLASKGE